MALNYSTVNFRNLIKDLKEMYSYDVSEVVLTEVVANSLDSGATKIKVDYDDAKKVLLIEDNGEGMSSRQFSEYHDFAAGFKKRGSGIGFAGIGAKISFNIADRVLTQTKSKDFSGGSNWYLRKDGKLVWEEISPQGIKTTGTKVSVNFNNSALVGFKEDNDLIKLLRKQYLPLFDKTFLKLYQKLGFYSDKLRFYVNGKELMPVDLSDEYKLDKIDKFFPKKEGSRLGYGVMGLSNENYVFDPLMCGVLVCTHGKIVKAELFNQFPGEFGPRIFGLVEIPGLIEFLTTSKTDFIKDRKNFRKFEGLYNPIRQEFISWIASLGVDQAGKAEGNEGRRLERDLKKLIDEIPELADFFGFRTRKNVLSSNQGGQIPAVFQEGVEVTFPDGKGHGGGDLGIPDEGEDPGKALHEQNKSKEKAKPISRKAKKGPKITFSPRSDREDIAWIEGNSVVINISHPSYKKSSRSNFSKYLFDMFAIANAIQKFINSNHDKEESDFMFIDRMMTAWGSNT